MGVIAGPTSYEHVWPAWPGLTDNEDKKGGRTLHFRNGVLTSQTRDSPPFLVYGQIYELWRDLNGVSSGLGYPLADYRVLEDRTTCIVFEGGHIHKVGEEDPQM